MVLPYIARLIRRQEFRDVAWKPWDGNYDTLAHASSAMAV